MLSSFVELNQGMTGAPHFESALLLQLQDSMLPGDHQLVKGSVGFM